MATKAKYILHGSKEYQQATKLVEARLSELVANKITMYKLHKELSISKHTLTMILSDLAPQLLTDAQRGSLTTVKPTPLESPKLATVVLPKATTVEVAPTTSLTGMADQVVQLAVKLTQQAQRLRVESERVEGYNRLLRETRESIQTLVSQMETLSKTHQLHQAELDQVSKDIQNIVNHTAVTA